MLRSHSLDDPISMSFSPAVQLWATIMVRDPMLFCDAFWFKPNEVYSFLAARYIDGSNMLPGALSLDHILYVEWQRRCALSLGKLVRERCRWSRGTWSTKSGQTLPKLSLVELLVLKDSLRAGSRLLCASF